MFKNLELSGLEVTSIFLEVTLATLGVIIYFKVRYATLDYTRFASYITRSKTRDLTKKFIEVDVLNKTTSFFNFGMLVGVVLSLAALSWTTYEDLTYQTEGLQLVDDIIEVDIPRTADAQLVLPPPPSIEIMEVPDAEVVVDTKYEQLVVSTSDVVIGPLTDIRTMAPPVLPKTQEIDEIEIFTRAEQMPRFPGCEDLATKKDKTACATQKMLEYIYKYLKYPAIARENGVQGNVVLQFVVDKDGSITDTKIARDIGAGCGAAAEAVVLSMNQMDKKWTPGKQKGLPVKVLYTLPVNFRLE